MTETEQLKKETEKQYINQRIEEVNLYIDELIKKIDAAEQKSKWGERILFITWIMWIIGDFYNLYTVGISIYLFASFLRTYLEIDGYRLRGEMRGALTVLGKLGLIKDIDTLGKTKRKRKVWSEGISMVRKWVSDKKLAQDKVYSPA